MLKEITPVYPVITNGSMTGTSVITFLPTAIQYKDSFAYELSWTGNPTGTFEVQGSVTYNPGNVQSGGAPNAGNWVTIPAKDQNGNSPVAAGSAGVILINLNQLGFPWIRVIYTNSSGTGTLQATVFGKSLG